MEDQNAKHLDIIAMSSTLKENRIELYQSIIKEIKDHTDLSREIEKLLSFWIINRNQRLYGKRLSELVKKELDRIQEDGG